MDRVEFTPRWLDNLKPAVVAPQYEVADTLVSGLRVRVGSKVVAEGRHKGRAANISFILVARFPPSKQPTRRVIGQYQRSEVGMTLQEARATAAAWKDAIRTGVDPTARSADERDGAATCDSPVEDAAPSTSVADALDLYETNKLALLDRGSGVRRALDGREGVLKELKDQSIRSLTRADLAQRIRDRAKIAPVSANRQLSYLKTFLSWCVDEEFVDGNVAETIRKPSAENERDRYHSLPELAEIWTATAALGYPFGPLIQLLITLPMRREEIAAMKVAELSLGDDKRPDDAEWVLPGDRTKKKNALRVPLSALSRSIIKAAIAHPDRPTDSPFVFTTTSETSVSGFSKARKRLDEAISASRKRAALEADEEAEEMPHWVLHDLRTTFNTHACDRLQIDAAVADRILNHIATATRSKVMRIYNRSEMYEPRKHALAAWANLLTEEVIKTKQKRNSKERRTSSRRSTALPVGQPEAHATTR
ncbi:tyrosine-type recombinase/integrase [Sphingobium sp.]|uniref:tyrosine-type recombinase/integrase n=1 Tax=Sphingobium sp. TaxID=1912891 RepID=UPI0028BF41C3|nr:tyrosine-type recombinase/integrase [Sphingobium sp.]